MIRRIHIERPRAILVNLGPNEHKASRFDLHLLICRMNEFHCTITCLNGLPFYDGAVVESHEIRRLSLSLFVGASSFHRNAGVLSQHRWKSQRSMAYIEEWESLIKLGTQTSSRTFRRSGCLIQTVCLNDRRPRIFTHLKIMAYHGAPDWVPPVDGH